MKRPVWWFLIGGEDQPPDFRWYREPLVWLYVIGNAVWGLPCLVLGREYLFGRNSDSSFLLGLAKWIALVSCAAFPTLIIALRENERSHKPLDFWIIVGVSLFGVVGATFGGSMLGLILDLCGVESFLGIPVGL